MSFYEMRMAVLTKHPAAHRLLEDMRAIVRAEKAASARMIELCEQDSRLGYHSEAEVFKFYPEKLRWRINELEKLEPQFDMLFDKTPEEIADLLAWEGVTLKAGEVCRGESFSWKIEQQGMKYVFNMQLDPDALEKTREVFLVLMDTYGVKFPVSICLNKLYGGFQNQSQGITICDDGKGMFSAEIPCYMLEYARELFVGVGRVMHADENGKVRIEGSPVKEGEWESRLNLAYGYASKLGKVIF